MRHLTDLLKRLLLQRRLLAGLAAMIAVLAIFAAVSGQDEPSVQVLTASSRIAAGTVVTADQVRQTSVPQRLCPQGALEQLPDSTMTAGAIPAGAILTTEAFVASSQVSPGHVIIPLSVSAQIMAIIQPGDQIAVFLGDLGGEAMVTHGIRVVTIVAAASGGMFSAGGSPDFILVEAPEAVAARLASAGSLGTVMVAIE